VKTAGYYLLGFGVLTLIVPPLAKRLDDFGGVRAQESISPYFPITAIFSFGLAGWFLSKTDNPKDGWGHRLLMAFVTIPAAFIGMAALWVAICIFIAAWRVMASGKMPVSINDIFDPFP